ncbi:unnamed protein product [Vitrella brassicaformis CCMP3155]|uniref:Uncharacterized protein n=1 Tax=Vitrella brassicaformis (strain CCMP3155) TaxID=1169540 RepID=A0A0G4G6L0_VITBC|nr:unnamed protein product [Vitrella brassicaformis CCMP3155]|eukprot:CEM24106.1 unnamed protein product [Vitrella brassicaformis CCMP3155]
MMSRFAWALLLLLCCSTAASCVDVNRSNKKKALARAGLVFRSVRLKQPAEDQPSLAEIYQDELQSEADDLAMPQETRPRRISNGPIPSHSIQRDKEDPAIAELREMQQAAQDKQQQMDELEEQQEQDTKQKEQVNSARVDSQQRAEEEEEQKEFEQAHKDAPLLSSFRQRNGPRKAAKVDVTNGAISNEHTPPSLKSQMEQEERKEQVKAVLQEVEETAAQAEREAVKNEEDEVESIFEDAAVRDRQTAAADGQQDEYTEED